MVPVAWQQCRNVWDFPAANSTEGAATARGVGCAGENTAWSFLASYKSWWEWGTGLFSRFCVIPKEAVTLGSASLWQSFPALLWELFSEKMADPEGLGPELTFPDPGEALPVQSEHCWSRAGKHRPSSSSPPSPVQVIQAGLGQFLMLIKNHLLVRHILHTWRDSVPSS